VIGIVIALLVSIVCNGYFLIKRFNKGGDLVITYLPNGKRTFRFELSKEPDDIRVGDTFLLAVKKGEAPEDDQDELPFAE
jgi:hypothetical protein